MPNSDTEWMQVVAAVGIIVVVVAWVALAVGVPAP
jgi:hypothetical protein